MKLVPGLGLGAHTVHVQIHVDILIYSDGTSLYSGKVHAHVHVHVHVHVCPCLLAPTRMKCKAKYQSSLEISLSEVMLFSRKVQLLAILCMYVPS